MSRFFSGKIVYNNVLFLRFLFGDKHLLHSTENQFMYFTKAFLICSDNWNTSLLRSTDLLCGMKNVHGIYHNRHFTLRQLSKAFHAKRDRINAIRENKNLTCPWDRNLHKPFSFVWGTFPELWYIFICCYYFLCFCQWLFQILKESKFALLFSVFFFSGGEKWYAPLWENFDLITH